MTCFPAPESVRCGADWGHDCEQRSAMTPDNKPNIVLVHGAWADGSSWSAVIEQLQAAGHEVTAPQFGMSGLSDDVARLRQAWRILRRHRSRLLGSGQPPRVHTDGLRRRPTPSRPARDLGAVISWSRRDDVAQGRPADSFLHDAGARRWIESARVLELAVSRPPQPADAGRMARDRQSLL